MKTPASTLHSIEPSMHAWQAMVRAVGGLRKDRGSLVWRGEGEVFTAVELEDGRVEVYLG